MAWRGSPARFWRRKAVVGKGDARSVAQLEVYLHARLRDSLASEPQSGPVQVHRGDLAHALGIAGEIEAGAKAQLKHWRGGLAERLLAQGRDLGPTKHAVHQPGENRTGVKAHTPFLPERGAGCTTFRGRRRTSFLTAIKLGLRCVGDAQPLLAIGGCHRANVEVMRLVGSGVEAAGAGPVTSFMKS